MLLVYISSYWSFYQSGVRLVRGIVKDVEEKKIILNDGTEVPYGLLVWSTGVGPSAIIRSLDLPKAPGGRLFLLLNIVALIFFLLAAVSNLQIGSWFFNRYSILICLIRESRFQFVQRCYTLYACILWTRRLSLAWIKINLKSMNNFS